MIDFPVTPEAMLSVASVAILGALITQWLKRYIALDVVINVTTLLLCEALSLLATLIVADWQPTASALYSGALVGFVGATLATFGYEVVKNAVELVRPPTV